MTRASETCEAAGSTQLLIHRCQVEQAGRQYSMKAMLNANTCLLQAHMR